MTRDDRKKLSRRRTMQGMGAVVGAAAVGCKDDDTAAEGSTSGGTAGDDPTGAETGSTGEQGSTGDDGGPMGSACDDPGSLSVDELLAPIDTIVVVMMENRSFDHYFAARKLIEGLELKALSGNETNPDGSGNPIGVFPMDLFVIDDDPPHGWSSSRRQWNQGQNDGFVTEYIAYGASDPSLVMGYHLREHLPILWSLADEYVLCDHWFSSVMGPTWPNRFYLHLGTSNGETGNNVISGVPSIFDRLDDAGITNAYYHSTLAVPVTYGKTEGLEPLANFFQAAASGTLPQFCMVDPTFSVLTQIGNDDHPPADIRMGQAFLASIYQALAQSPQWDRCLLIISYDEHGGFYDHVSPPTTFDPLPEFQQLGFRVPSLVIGPHVRRGCVNALQFDHVSVLSTVTRRFGLEPLNERVAMTSDLSSAIDPLFVNDPRPPAPLPPVEIRMPRTFESARPFRGGQTELFELIGRMKLPRHLDLRHDFDRVMRQTLETGAGLGAVKIIG
jgi:phospholipase C